ncbi:hypothetical protein FACS18942_02220 [Planctomycetales bacterium]|nr:hypothetical protein FACS18942_02220 [Planctomycetales bacterium]
MYALEGVPYAYEVSVVTIEMYHFPDDLCISCGDEDNCGHSCTLGTTQGVYGYRSTTNTVYELLINPSTGQKFYGLQLRNNTKLIVTKTSRRVC